MVSQDRLHRIIWRQVSLQEGEGPTRIDKTIMDIAEVLLSLRV